MSRCHGLRFLVAVAISIAFTASVRCEQPTSDTPQSVPAAKQVRTDLDGNPLPQGAIARMGSVGGKHEDIVTSVAFVPDGKALASANGDKTVRLWEVSTGKEIRQFRGHLFSVNSVAFSPDGKKLASASDDKTVRLWEVSTGKEIHQFQGHKLRICSVAYSPDGKALASAGQGGVVPMWKLDSGKEIFQLQGHQNLVFSVAFSPDGKTLASGSADMTVVLWNTVSGKEIRQLQGHQDSIFSVVFSPDGKTLASAGQDKTVRLWETATGKEICQFQGHQGTVWSVVFSPDGKTLASASWDETVRLWETASGKEIKQLQGQQGQVFSVAFSPDGKTLASAGENMTALVWRLSEIYCGDSSTAKIDAKHLESLWADLADKDATKAYQAIGTLIVGFRDAMTLLQERLQPSKESIAPQRTARLLTDLDNDEYEVRENASKELAKVGELALPALEKSLAGDPSPETRYRVERLLDKLSTPTPERLRTMRAVMVLEQIGTPEAKQLLETLAKGADGALLTEESRAARKRLKP